ncbi:MAG TPA: transposase [Anaerolineae bacterium]|nr:transposase [Anaerolineae bacterium]HQH38733.1 transposase [Anaerolineae bacterium]
MQHLRHTGLYTSKHASWMNQVEIWLSVLVHKVLKRGNFTSRDELKCKMLALVAYYNRIMAKPFKWFEGGSFDENSIRP